MFQAQKFQCQVLEAVVLTCLCFRLVQVKMDKELSAEIFKIQSIDRALRIPSVNYLWGKSTKVYGRVKSANIFTNWAFGTVENMFGAVLEKSLPVARLMEKPICNLDKTLCQGFDFVEVKLPIIKEEPQAVRNILQS